MLEGIASNELDCSTTWMPEDANETSSYLMSLVRDGFVEVSLPASPPDANPDETPVEGAAAVARWLALYGRAKHLRSNLVSGNVMYARQAQRADRSLGLASTNLQPRHDDVRELPSGSAIDVTRCLPSLSVRGGPHVAAKSASLYSGLLSM